MSFAVMFSPHAQILFCSVLSCHRLSCFVRCPVVDTNTTRHGVPLCSVLISVALSGAIPFCRVLSYPVHCCSVLSVAVLFCPLRSCPPVLSGAVMPSALWSCCRHVLSPCCLVLSCLVLSSAVLFCIIPSCPISTVQIPSCPVLSCPRLCGAPPSCPVLSCGGKRSVPSCFVLSCYVLFSVILSRAVLSCRVLCCPVVSCPVLSSAVLFCPPR